MGRWLYRTLQEPDETFKESRVRCTLQEPDETFREPRVGRALQKSDEAIQEPRMGRALQEEERARIGGLRFGKQHPKEISTSYNTAHD